MKKMLVLILFIFLNVQFINVSYSSEYDEIDIDMMVSNTAENNSEISIFIQQKVSEIAEHPQFSSNSREIIHTLIRSNIFQNYIYFNISASYLILENSEHKFLFGKRIADANHLASYYSLIAGHQQKSGLSPKEVIIKKTTKEANIIIEEKDIKFMHFLSVPNKDRINLFFYCNTFKFQTDYDSIEKINNRLQYHTELKWFTEEQIDLMYKNQQNLLKEGETINPKKDECIPLYIYNSFKQAVNLIKKYPNFNDSTIYSIEQNSDQ